MVEGKRKAGFSPSERRSEDPGERLWQRPARALPDTSYNRLLAPLRNGQILLEQRHGAAHDELEVASLGKVGGDRVVHRLARFVQRD